MLCFSLVYLYLVPLLSPFNSRVYSMLLLAGPTVVEAQDSRLLDGCRRAHEILFSLSKKVPPRLRQDSEQAKSKCNQSFASVYSLKYRHGPRIPAIRPYSGPLFGNYLRGIHNFSELWIQSPCLGLSLQMRHVAPPLGS